VRDPHVGVRGGLIAAALLLPATPAAAQSPPPWLKVENGVTQRVFRDTIEQTVFVEAKIDSDHDGRNDRIRIRISRPAARGAKVPVIFEHSPYRGRLGLLRNHDVDVGRLPNLPDTQLDDYYVPRGYAVVLGESIGTFHSDGCADVGGPNEARGTEAVIDWLNGRARGFTRSGRRVRAGWTTGAVGMIGTSYNGTLANQVATTGVEGLRTIVPISSISSWYDYYRANGLVVAPHSRPGGVRDNEFLGEDMDVLARFIGGNRCAAQTRRLRRAQDRATGDSSAFWAARDYLGRAGSVTASVLLVHGLNDFNVRTKAFAAWWERLTVPKKIFLHNRGHDDPAARGSPYKRTEHRWFDHWLHGVPNGITDEPRATIQREDGSFQAEADWPAPGTADTALHLAAPGGLSTTVPAASPDQHFVDRGRTLDADRVLIRRPDAAHPNRLVYRTPPLATPARISGTPRVALNLSIDNRNAANLTAVLVDYGPNGAAMVTRGWLDPRNRDALGSSTPIERRRKYGFQWDLQPDDHVFAAGHRIGLVVLSTDHDYTLRPRPGTQLTLHPDGSALSLPIVGGALGF
jgi:X-Pro dipeptidyl-peptidase